MEKEKNKKYLKLSYLINCDLRKSYAKYFYRGRFSDNIVTNILTIVQSSLKKDKHIQKIKKKIFYILVETLQNVTRHQTITHINSIDSSCLFSIQEDDKNFVITTANVIKKNKIPDLKLKLETINQKKSRGELKSYYYSVLENGTLSDKGGAGLGLIAMTMRSSRQIVFDFKPINDEYEFFYFAIVMPFHGTADASNDKKYLEKIINIHDIVCSEDVLLNYNKTFNHNHFINLVEILSDQFQHKIKRQRKFLQIIMLMLQNIVYYAESLNDSINSKSNGNNPGMFMLHESKNEYIFTTGNFIETSKIEILRDKINKTNNLGRLELDKLYLKTLFKFNETKKRPDLSIIEMRKKSHYKLDYDFRTINNIYSYFSLQLVMLDE